MYFYSVQTVLPQSPEVGSQTLTVFTLLERTKYEGLPVKGKPRWLPPRSLGAGADAHVAASAADRLCSRFLHRVISCPSASHGREISIEVDHGF